MEYQQPQYVFDGECVDFQQDEVLDLVKLYNKQVDSERKLQVQFINTVK